MEIVRHYEDKYLAIIEDYGYDLLPEYKFRTLKSMWGVCYPKKNLICFNDKLIHFEPKYTEAILFHELLHFVIPNHSKRFHDVLNYHMPDYKERLKKIY